MARSGDGAWPDDTPETEVAEWVMRMADPMADAKVQAAFHDWLERDPAHRTAFEAAQRTWQELGLIDQADIPPRPRRGSAALVLAALVTGASLWLWQDDLRIRMQADYAAPVGESRTVLLEDGSRVELSSGSALAVDYDGARRLVRLLQGSAYFTAQPAAMQQDRPFVVEAEDIRVTALGTQFSVELHQDDVEVLVAEHSVRVEPITGPAAPVVLAQGMGVEARADVIAEPAPRDVDSVNAWRSGLLVFDDQPLAEVVAELNRYRHGRIVLRGADVASRRVSGVFRTDNIAQAEARIATELGLRRLSILPLLTVLH